MSGQRPLARSPKLADGMTSEAIEESAVNVFMVSDPCGLLFLHHRASAMREPAGAPHFGRVCAVRITGSAKLQIPPDPSTLS
jgi:hypothetical protein